MAVLAKAEGDQDEAERLYRRAIVIGEELGDVVGMSIDMFNLARLCENQGRLDEALPLLERAVETAEQVGMSQAENRRCVLERVRGKLGGGHYSELRKKRIGAERILVPPRLFGRS